ncbi:protein JASON-like [Typha latifolia]|uniref:protein JASON-like n=1 Tax=Typha latifolia TaxID=4733 RepID=UPI003C2DFCCA
MGCLFGCFRIKDGERRNHLISSSIASRSEVINGEKLVSKKLASFFLREEEEDSPCEQADYLNSQQKIDKVSSDRELQYEAKFLKSCGALLETPAEIRKTSENINAGSHDKDGIPSISSWLPSMSGRVLLMEGKNAELLGSPAESHESSGFPETGSSTCKGHQSSRHYVGALRSDSSSKSLHFEGVKHEPGLEESWMSSFSLDATPIKREDKQIPMFGSKHSPFPTPLKVTEEMYTPATAYPGNFENLRSGKNARIRTQYVYPVLNPVESFSQWKVLKEGSYEPGQSQDIPEQEKNASLDTGKKSQMTSQTSASQDSKLYHSLEFTSPGNERRQHISAASSANNSLREKPSTNMTPLGRKIPLDQDDPDLVVASLSQWLKPPSANKEVSEMFRRDKSHSGKSSDGDRPIIGMVAAHWNDEEPDRISPKSWDRNGIPNSTNKYKEDQKVSWHATPFEERLEKALSEEKLLSQRISFNKDESEESDTAAS